MLSDLIASKTSLARTVSAAVKTVQRNVTARGELARKTHLELKTALFCDPEVFEKR